MTIQALSRVIVETVLSRLDSHTFAAIPEADIRTACNAVAQLIREESATCVHPDGEDDAP